MNKTQSSKKSKPELIAILDELLVLQKFMDSFPKGKGSKKVWSEGMVFGIKYAIKHLAKKFNDPKQWQRYNQMLDWQAEEQKLLGKKSYQAFQKLRS